MDELYGEGNWSVGKLYGTAGWWWRVKYGDPKNPRRKQDQATTLDEVILALLDFHEAHLAN